MIGMLFELGSNLIENTGQNAAQNGYLYEADCDCTYDGKDYEMNSGMRSRWMKTLFMKMERR